MGGGGEERRGTSTHSPSLPEYCSIVKSSRVDPLQGLIQGGVKWVTCHPPLNFNDIH